MKSEIAPAKALACQIDVQIALCLVKSVLYQNYQIQSKKCKINRFFALLSFFHLVCSPISKNNQGKSQKPNSSHHKSRNSERKQRENISLHQNPKTGHKISPPAPQTTTNHYIKSSPSGSKHLFDGKKGNQTIDLAINHPKSVSILGFFPDLQQNVTTLSISGQVKTPVTACSLAQGISQPNSSKTAKNKKKQVISHHFPIRSKQTQTQILPASVLAVTSKSNAASMSAVTSKSNASAASFNSNASAAAFKSNASTASLNSNASIRSTGSTESAESTRSTESNAIFKVCSSFSAPSFKSIQEYWDRYPNSFLTLSSSSYSYPGSVGNNKRPFSHQPTGLPQQKKLKICDVVYNNSETVCSKMLSGQSIRKRKRLVCDKSSDSRKVQKVQEHFEQKISFFTFATKEVLEIALSIFGKLVLFRLCPSDNYIYKC